MHSTSLTKDTTLMRHRYQSFILILHSQAFMHRPPGSSNPPASELHQDKSSYWPNRGALIKHSVDTTTPKWITHLLTTRSDKRYPSRHGFITNSGYIWWERESQGGRSHEKDAIMRKQHCNLLKFLQLSENLLFILPNKQWKQLYVV